MHESAADALFLAAMTPPPVPPIARGDTIVSWVPSFVIVCAFAAASAFWPSREARPAPRTWSPDAQLRSSQDQRGATRALLKSHSTGDLRGDLEGMGWAHGALGDDDDAWTRGSESPALFEEEVGAEEEEVPDLVDPPVATDHDTDADADQDQDQDPLGGSAVLTRPFGAISPTPSWHTLDALSTDE
jgi:hypothetical protein